MFSKPKAPLPEPLTDDETRSKTLLDLWDRYAKYQAVFDNKQFWHPDRIGLSEPFEKAKLNLAGKRRNFQINLKNHGGFYDWLRRRTLPEPLSEDEKTNNDYLVRAIMEDFHRNYNRSWNAATDPPGDFLNWFEHCDPEIYVNDKLEKHLKKLIAARRGEAEPKDTGEQFVYAKDPRFEDFAIIIPPLPSYIFNLMCATHSSPSMDILQQQPFVKEGETIADLREYNGEISIFSEVYTKNTTHIVAPVSGKIISESGSIAFGSKWSEKTGPEILGGHYMRQLAKIRPVKGSDIQNATLKTYRHIIAFCEQFVREPDRLKQYPDVDYPADAEKLERAISLLKDHQTVTTETEEQERLKRKAKPAVDKAEREREATPEELAKSAALGHQGAKKALKKLSGKEARQQATPEFDRETGEIFDKETKPPEAPKSPETPKKKTKAEKPELPLRSEEIAASEAFKGKPKSRRDQHIPKVREALNRWELSNPPSCDAINDKYMTYVNKDIPPQMLARINDDYELLMETFCSKAP